MSRCISETKDKEDGLGMGTDDGPRGGGQLASLTEAFHKNSTHPIRHCSVTCREV